MSLAVKMGPLLVFILALFSLQCGDTASDDPHADIDVRPDHSIDGDSSLDGDLADVPLDVPSDGVVDFGLDLLDDFDMQPDAADPDVGPGLLTLSGGLVPLGSATEANGFQLTGHITAGIAPIRSSGGALTLDHLSTTGR